MQWLGEYDESLIEGPGPAVKSPPFDPGSIDPDTAASLAKAREIIEQLSILGSLDRVLVGENSRSGSAAGQPPADPAAFHAALDGANDSPLGDHPPRQLGRFQIVRELGRGGLGVVFLARDPLDDRQIALKVPRPEAVFTPDLRRRFAREANATLRLKHPNLVPIHEIGASGPIAYIVAAYCPGPSLAAWLATRSDRVGPAVAARIVVQLADGIAYAHSQGVLHRDLKPGNVLLEMDDEARAPEGSNTALGFTPKIIDFGLARVGNPTDGATRTGAALGTPGYMSPEQAEGRVGDVGPATDVYGLGTILYELLTGEPMFRSTSDADVLRKVISYQPVRPRRSRPDLPPDLEAICLKCLEKEPTLRYAGADALGDDLRRFLAGEPTRARPRGPLIHWLSRAFRRLRGTPLLTVGLVAVAELAVGLPIEWRG